MDAEQIKKDRQMFGCSAEEIREAAAGVLAGHMGPELFAMGVLSDAQEMIEQGNKEAARQYINRAKLLLDDMRKARRTL